MIKGRKKDRNGVDHASIKFQGYLLDKICLCLVKKKKNQTSKTQSYLSEFCFSLHNFIL